MNSCCLLLTVIRLKGLGRREIYVLLAAFQEMLLNELRIWTSIATCYLNVDSSKSLSNEECFTDCLSIVMNS